MKNESNHSLDLALKTYSTYELSNLLGVSETSVRRYKLKEKNPNLSAQKILDTTTNLLKEGTDFRELYFNSWRKKILSDSKWIKLRLLRDILGISSEQLANKMGCDRRYINRIEMLESKASDKLYNKYKKILYSIKKPSKKDLEKRDEFLQVFLFQVKELRKENIPEIVKIIPTFNKDKYYGGAKIHKFLKDNFGKVYFGPILSDKNTNKKHIFDILCVNKNKKYLFEIKIFKYFSRDNLISLLNYLFYRLKRVNEVFPDFKLGLIIPNQMVGSENKKKFLRYNFLILDKSNLLNGENIQNSIKEDILSNLSYQQLVFILESNGYKLKGKYLSYKIGTLKDKLKDAVSKKKIQKIIGEINRKSMQRELFQINKKLALNNYDLVFLRNARKALGLSLKDIANLFFNGHQGHTSSFERGLEFSIKKIEAYKLFVKKRLSKDVKEKIAILIKFEKERWKIAEKFFPFVIQLRKGSDDKLENSVSAIFRKHKFMILRNAEVCDKYLKLKCGGRFPEIDILARKNNKNYMILCNGMKKRHRNKFLKNVIFKLKELSNLGVIAHLILVTKKANPKSIIAYGKTNNVNVLSINELKNFLEESKCFI